MAAIYMWPIGDGVLVTTTPYPIEELDKIDFSATALKGNFVTVLDSKLNSTFDIGTFSYIQKRWFYEDGPYDDELESTFELGEFTYTQKRWFYEDGPYEDSVESTFVLGEFTYERKLIYADSPDEKLNLQCTPSTESNLELAE